MSDPDLATLGDPAGDQGSDRPPAKAISEATARYTNWAIFGLGCVALAIWHDRVPPRYIPAVVVLLALISWLGWATPAWALLAYGIGQAAAIGAIALWNVAHGMPWYEVNGYDGAQIALLTLVANPLQVVVLARIVRSWPGANPIEYLGLTRFSLRNFLIGVVAIVAVVAAVDGFSRFAPSDTVTPFEVDIFTSGRAEGWLTAVMIAVVLVGPIGEEVLFRGFLFRRWVTPDWHGAVAVVVIPLLWAAMHLQYDWFGISQVFLIGLVLSWIRWRSGSCLLTIVLHVLVNLIGMVEVALKVGWPGT